MLDHVILSEKYRPHTLKECILSNNLRNTFENYIKSGKIPNLLLAGPPGMGKTTIAQILCSELNYDVLKINGSLDRNIDTLRNEIMSFASTVSFEGKRKCVLIDEADFLNITSTQPALRNFIETFSDNCSFIMTCNYKNKIMKELHSRLSVIEFSIPKDELKPIFIQLYKRVEYILTQEKITFDKDVLVAFLKKYFPDFRKILTELQSYISNSNNTIDVGILGTKADEKISTLIAALKTKNFKEMRLWVATNTDVDFHDFVRHLYDNSSFVEDSSIPQMILHLANYSYKSAFVVDKEINTVAMLTEIMVDCKFKG